jgi:hypothetical protein
MEWHRPQESLPKDFEVVLGYVGFGGIYGFDTRGLLQVSFCSNCGWKVDRYLDSKSNEPITVFRWTKLPEIPWEEGDPL